MGSNTRISTPLASAWLPLSAAHADTASSASFTLDRYVDEVAGAEAAAAERVARHLLGGAL